MKKTWRIVGFAAVLMMAVAIGACKGKTPQASLTLQKTSFMPGEGIAVSYSALPEYDSSAWIGIVPSAVPHGSESENDRHDIAYQYLRKSTGGTLTFAAPNQPGTYDLRMHNTDSAGVEVASVTFTVTGDAQPAEATAATKTEPAPAAAAPSAGARKLSVGEPCMVEWKGSWWPAKVIETREGAAPYKIHYDGYSNSWDEWVGDKRIRQLAKGD